MKLTSVVLAAIVINISLRNEVFGQLLNENFDYGISDNGDITLVTDNWIRHNGTQGPAYKATGLAYLGYVSSEIGGSVWFTRGSSGINDGDINRKFSSIDTTNNVFVSFMVRIDSVQTTADYFFHMGPNDLSMTHHGRIFARRNGTGWG